MWLSPFDGTLPEHCTPTTPFLVETSKYFHTCVPTPLAFISTLLGALSIVSWFFAQMPQIYKNYQLQSTAGLSIIFLGEWLLGDATNLAGALLTNQAAWQVVVASYYVFVDVCLVSQFFWYTHIKPWKEGRPLHSSGSSELSDDDSDIINDLSPINTNFARDFDTADVYDEENERESTDSKHPTPSKPKDVPNFSKVTYEKDAKLSGTSIVRVKDPSWLPTPSPRTVLYIATLCALIQKTAAAPVQPEFGIQKVGNTDLLVWIGTILSWCSTVLYLGSRIPQLYKNWCRRSTAGLSPLLFFAAFCGNTFYSTSLLTSPFAWYDLEPYGGHGWAGPEGSNRWEWIASAAPFFLGAAGVLGLDAFMGVQFMIYGDHDEEKIVKVRDSHGRTRWERVSGWMRGWVPSVTPERTVSIAEGEALIRSSRELDRHSYGATD